VYADTEITFDYGPDLYERTNEIVHSAQTEGSQSVSCSGESCDAIGREGGGVSTTQELYRRLEERALRLSGLDVRPDLAFNTQDTVSREFRGRYVGFDVYGRV